MTEALKSELAYQIAENHALVVAGTGVSLAATGGKELASWKGLIANGIKRCVDAGLRKPEWAASQQNLLNGDLDDLLGVAEQVSRRLGWKPTEPCDGEWSAWLRTTVGELRAKQPELIQAIRDLDAPIATLNYDNLLTEVTGRRPIPWKSAERWLPVLEGKDEAILHLHGHWDQPSSVVLGIRSYDAVMGKELAQHLQRVLASLHSLVFIGCSGTLQDPNFSALVGWMRDQLRGAEHSHYLLLRESEPPPIEESLLRQARIVTLRYGAAHADLLPFIRSLVPSSRAEESASNSAKNNRSLDAPASAPEGVASGKRTRSARSVSRGSGTRAEAAEQAKEQTQEAEETLAFPAAAELAPAASFSIHNPVVIADLLFITLFAALAFVYPFSDPFLSFYIAAAVISLSLTLIVLGSGMSDRRRTAGILLIFLLMGAVAIYAVLWRYLDMHAYCAGHGPEPFGRQNRGDYLDYVFVIAIWFCLSLLSVLKFGPNDNNLFEWMVILMIWLISCRILWYVVEQCEWIS